MVAQRFENPPQRGLVNRRVDLNRDAGQDNVHQTGLALVDLGHSRITADGIAAVNASIGFVTAMRRDDIDTRETWPRWRNNTEGAGQQLSAPRKQQTGINVVLARNRAHRHTARKTLCHNLALLLYRPDPPALSPRRHPDPRTPRSHTISRMTIYKDRLNNLSRVIACHPQQASQPHSVPQCAAAATLTSDEDVCPIRRRSQTGPYIGFGLFDRRMGPPGDIPADLAILGVAVEDRPRIGHADWAEEKAPSLESIRKHLSMVPDSSCGISPDCGGSG
jgi:hypothetical protein